MRMSATSEFTTVASATPRMKAIARASAFVLSRNALNSDHTARASRTLFPAVITAGWVPDVRPRAPEFVATWRRRVARRKWLTVQSDWRRLISTLRGRVLIARNQGKTQENAA